MSKVSFIGTIQDVETFNVASASNHNMPLKPSPEQLYFIKTKEKESWFISADSTVSRNSVSLLQKGSKYLFSGSLTCSKPVFLVEYISPDDSGPTFTEMAYNSCDTNIKLRGEITETVFGKTEQGNDVLYARFKDMPDLEIIFFSDLCEEFRLTYRAGKELSLIGELNIRQNPQFCVEEARLIA